MPEREQLTTDRLEGCKFASRPHETSSWAEKGIRQWNCSIKLPTTKANSECDQTTVAGSSGIVGKQLTTLMGLPAAPVSQPKALVKVEYPNWVKVIAANKMIIAGQKQFQKDAEWLKMVLVMRKIQKVEIAKDLHDANTLKESLDDTLTTWLARFSTARKASRACGSVVACTCSCAL